jgi:hypothetical protein
MTQPLIVSIPHRLGKAEAISRLKTGMGRARSDFSALISIDEETWNGDAVTFRLRALGQGAAGTIHVFDDQVRLEIVLPWLLAKVAERFVPQIRKETTLLLEKK